ncbi:MAG: anti-sigma F factor [Oscillospiraceae bacterium]|nr:anti-sigma F factor [Oscillospiraceae bacterium]
MKSENHVTLEFPSNSCNESFARAAAACFAAQLDPTLDELNDIKTAVSEAVTNCIVHAYPDSIGKSTMKLKLLPDQTVAITVKDRGCGIADIGKARQPMFTTGNEERSGMGFTIMESFMSELRVLSKPGKGTTVHMKRRIRKRGS